MAAPPNGAWPRVAGWFHRPRRVRARADTLPDFGCVLGCRLVARRGAYGQGRGPGGRMEERRQDPRIDGVVEIEIRSRSYSGCANAASNRVRPCDLRCHTRLVRSPRTRSPTLRRAIDFRFRADHLARHPQHHGKMSRIVEYDIDNAMAVIVAMACFIRAVDSRCSVLRRTGGQEVREP